MSTVSREAVPTASARAAATGTAPPTAKGLPKLAAPVIALVAALVVAPARADRPDRPWYRGKLSATTGFSYTEGDYGGSADTEVWYVPFSVKYSFRELGLTRWDRIDLKVTVPFLELTGPAGASFDLTGDVIPGTGDVESHEGIGDVSVSAKYLYVSGAHTPIVGLATKLKIPTGDESNGLGSGSVDLTFSGEVSQTFEIGADVLLTPFAEVGYRWRDDRRDQLRAATGFSVRPHDRIDVGVSYQYGTKSSSGSRDRHELSSFAAFRVSDSFSVEPFALVGLSRSTADFGAGLMLRTWFYIGD